MVILKLEVEALTGVVGGTIAGVGEGLTSSGVTVGVDGAVLMSPSGRSVRSCEV